MTFIAHLTNGVGVAVENRTSEEAEELVGWLETNIGTNPKARLDWRSDDGTRVVIPLSSVLYVEIRP